MTKQAAGPQENRKQYLEGLLRGFSDGMVMEGQWGRLRQAGHALRAVEWCKGRVSKGKCFQELT